MGLLDWVLRHRRSRPGAGSPSSRAERIATNASGYETAHIYDELRMLAWSAQPSGADSFTEAPATILIETGYPEAVVTLLIAGDETVSLYFSDGGGIIGAGEHEAVRTAAERLRRCLGERLNVLARAQDLPLPARGRVRFHVRTAAGAWTADVAEHELGNNRHVLSEAFHMAHGVITAIRAHAPQQEAEDAPAADL